MIAALLLLLALQTPTVPPNTSVHWDYDDVDAIAGNVAQFLVCLDGQATALCAVVPVNTTGQLTAPSTKSYVWKLPALTAGAHTVSVQACTAGSAACSTGVSLGFTAILIANPKNLHLGGGE